MTTVERVCPPDPDREIAENGEKVFMTSTISADKMEAWVCKVRERSGQRVDWYFGGHAIVRAIGDIDRAKEAIREFMPEHDIMYRDAVRGLFPRTPTVPIATSTFSAQSGGPTKTNSRIREAKEPPSGRPPASRVRSLFTGHFSWFVAIYLVARQPTAGKPQPFTR